jgi:LytR cell envelope-related transcriptional attenuator
MTMMTPMGRGGHMYPRARRWPRVLAVFLVLVLLAAAGTGAWWFLTQDENGTSAAPAPTNSCRTPTAKVPKKIPQPSQVSVDVRNGTDVAGLAITTSNDLSSRGFNISGIGNTDRPVKAGVARVRYRPAQLASAVQLASYVPGATLVPVQGLKGGSVELWIGPDFEGIVTKKNADLDAVTIPQPEPICPTPSKTKSKG